MSGGRWQYLSWQIRQAAEDIEQEIQGGGYEPETLACLRDAAYCLRRAAMYEHQVDYLLSGDHGEDGFRQALAVDLDEVEARVPFRGVPGSVVTGVLGLLLNEQPDATVRSTRYNALLRALSGMLD